MSRCPTEEERFAYADRTATAEERTRIAPHLRRCASCADEVRQIESLIQDVCTAYATWPEDLPSSPVIAPPANDVAGPAEIPYDEESSIEVPDIAPDADFAEAAPKVARAQAEPLPRPDSSRSKKGVRGLLPRWNVPGYRFIAPLQRGGMGAVYVALQESMDRQVAIKVLAPSLASDPQYVQRFEREAKACARLRHPNIVQVFDVGTVGRRPFLVMEYVDGTDLHKRLKRRPLKVGKALALAIAVASGLERAHNENIIHRDIKPANVLIGKDGTVKLTDLGLAKHVDEKGGSLTAVGTSLGSPSYMPPEQAKDFKQVGPQADVYSLGATLYHALYGHPPFEGDNSLQVLQMVLLEEPEFPDERADIPEGLVELLKICLAKDPAERYSDGAELLEALREVEAGRRPPRPRASPVKRPSGRVARRRRGARGEAGNSGTSPFLFIGIAAAAAILLAISAALYLRGRTQETPRQPDDIVETPADEPSDLLPEAPPQAPPVDTERVAALERSIAAFAERGDIDGVNREVSALLELDPEYDDEALQTWRSEAYTIHDTRKAQAAYRRDRPELYLAFRDGGVDAAQRFLGRFTREFSESDAVEALARDRMDLDVLDRLRESALSRLRGEIDREVELHLSDGYVARGQLLAVNGPTLELTDELIDFRELSADEQLRWGEVGKDDELVALSYIEPSRAYRSVAASLNIPEERYEQVMLFFNTEAETLLEEAELAGEAQDAELQYQLLAELDGYREAEPFLARGREMNRFVDQALTYIAQAGMPRENNPRPPRPDRTPPPRDNNPAGPGVDEGAVASVSEPPADLSTAQALKILQGLMTPRVIALEEEGRYAVEYTFAAYEEFEDWDLHIPKGFDQVCKSNWALRQELPPELAVVEDFKRVTDADRQVLFGKGWKRLLWLDLEFEGALTVEVDMLSLDGRNLGIGIGEAGRLLWGVQGFQTPRLVVDPADANSPIARRYAENFDDHGGGRKNALVWEQIYLYEMATDTNTKNQPSPNEQIEVSLHYTPDESGHAAVRLVDRSRPDRPKDLLAAEIDSFDSPQVALGTFGSQVAISRVRIEFGISDAELAKLKKD